MEGKYHMTHSENTIDDSTEEIIFKIIIILHYLSISQWETKQVTMERGWQETQCI